MNHKDGHTWKTRGRRDTTEFTNLSSMSSFGPLESLLPRSLLKGLCGLTDSGGCWGLLYRGERLLACSQRNIRSAKASRQGTLVVDLFVSIEFVMSCCDHRDHHHLGPDRGYLEHDRGSEGKHRAICSVATISKFLSRPPCTLTKLQNDVDLFRSKASVQLSLHLHQQNHSQTHRKPTPSLTLAHWSLTLTPTSKFTTINAARGISAAFDSVERKSDGACVDVWWLRGQFRNSRESYLIHKTIVIDRPSGLESLAQRKTLQIIRCYTE